MTTTLREEGQADHPAIRQLCELAGVGLDEPLRVYVDIALTYVAADDEPPWEERPNLAHQWSDKSREMWLAARGNEGKPSSQLQTDGLVQWQWEEGDELHRDGKVVWRTNSERFYVSVLLIEQCKVMHYVMSNDCKHLDPYNEAVGYTDPQLGPGCRRCPDHGVEISSDIDQSKWI